jgi:outer membrane protein assembly factor BamA
MKRIAVIALLCIASLPLLAADHQVTKIDFRSRLPETVLRSQSALTEGRAYSDRDLELAVSRLRRLPFVYDARYKLEGTTLIIDVADEYHFFYDVDVLGETQQSQLNQSELDTGVGGRMYFQPGGILEGAAGSTAGRDESNGSASAQYAHYGIAGTRAFASLSVTRALGGVFGDSDIQPRLTLGYPLSLEQTVSFAASQTGFRDTQSFAAISRPLRTTVTDNIFELHWTYDTTNDPFFATRGRTLTVFPTYRRFNDHFEGFSIHTILTNEERGSETSANASFQNFLTIGSRTALVAGLSVRNGRVRGTQTFETGVVRPIKRTNVDQEASLLLVHNLFDSSALNDSRHRFEAGITYARENVTRGKLLRHYSEEIGYVYRNRWGAVHLTAVRTPR